MQEQVLLLAQLVVKMSPKYFHIYFYSPNEIITEKQLEKILNSPDNNLDFNKIKPRKSFYPEAYVVL